MSDQTPTKNETDTEETSSWEVISEKNSSRSSSIENIAEEEFDKPIPILSTTDIDVEHMFIDIVEAAEENPDKCANNDEDVEAQRKEPSGFPMPDWKKLRSKAKKKLKSTNNFTAISVAASILLVTGITLLYCLGPTQANKISPNVVTNDYTEVINRTSKHVRDAFNQTSEILGNVYNSTCYRDSSCGEDFCIDNEDICFDDESSSEENILETNFLDLGKHFLSPEPDSSTSTGVNNNYFLKDLQNTTLNLISNIKDACMNPNIHIFLCSLMQDVCLIKLIQHLEKKQTLLENVKQTTQTEKKVKIGKLSKRQVSSKSKTIKSDKKSVKLESRNSKLEQKSMPHLKQNYSQRLFDELSRTKNNSNIEIPHILSTIGENIGTENGKSECERRFEELENKWQSVGKNHRQKMQEIKEKFKTEIYQMKGNEKELSMRKQKIKLIRDKYIQKLKADREKYFLQLKRIKDERQKVMNDICNRKKTISQARDAAVGNYGIIKPQFDFNDTFTLNKSEITSKPREPFTSSALQFEEYSNFWKNMSVPKTSSETTQKFKNNRISRKGQTNENISRNANESTSNDEVTYIHGVVSKLITNLTESLESLSLKSDSNLGVMRDRSKIFYPKPGKKTSKKLTKRSKQLKSLHENRENSVLVAHYPYTLKSTETNQSSSFLSTVSKSPSKRTVNGTEFAKQISAVFSKADVVPFSGSNSSYSFRTAATRSPTATKNSQDDEKKSNKTEIIPFQTSVKTTFSNISANVKENTSEENYLKGIVPFTPNSQKNNATTEKFKKEDDLQNKTEVVPFKRGVNETYSFVPITPKSLPFTINPQKVEQEETILQTNTNKSNIGSSSSLNSATAKPITLRSLLKRTRRLATEKKHSLSSKSELLSSPNDKFDEDEDLAKSIEQLRKSFEELSIEEDTEISESSNLSRTTVPPSNIRKPHKSESVLDESVENELKLILRETPKKQDLYQLLFDEKGQKVKKKEEIFENQYIKRFPIPSQLQLMSKQDPKLPKKVYLFKGRL